MPEINAYFVRKLIADIHQGKEVKGVQRDSVSNTESEPILEKELSPKSLRIKKHEMNRIKSMDNFMKFSWSWTL